MSDAPPSTTQRPTYSHWRKPTSPGVGPLGLVGTLLAFGGLLLVMLTTLFSLRAALVLAILVAGLLVPLVCHNKAGRNGYQIMVARIAWMRGRRRRQHIYRSGVAGPVPSGEHQLPGVLAASEAMMADDSYGLPFAMIRIPSTNHYTAVVRCEPEGGQLVDADQVDKLVAQWGQWLADLGHEPGLVAAAATIETAPDAGIRLAAEVQKLLKEGAPDLAHDMLLDAAASFPSGAAALSARVALTYSGRSRTRAEGDGLLGLRRGKSEAHLSRDPQSMAVEIGTRLPGLTRSLSNCGAGQPRPMVVSELAELIRVAYDPASAETIDEARQAGDEGLVCWENAGPAAHDEAWDHYTHDSGASITWQMVSAPRGLVQSRVLELLLAPEPELMRKRVTIVYRPYDPGRAAAVVDSDVRTTITRATRRRGIARAHESQDVKAAQKTAMEEAAGAGVVRFSLLVTATVDDPQKLRRAAAIVEHLGRACRIELRRCYGSQAPAFAANLGVGVVLPEHTAVHDFLHENL